MQEPFKSLPLIWVINEETLAVRSRQYNSTGQTELLTDWKKIFSRASVVVFHNYLLPVSFRIRTTKKIFLFLPCSRFLE